MPVLRYSCTGGISGDEESYTIYGDGRIERTTVPRGLSARVHAGSMSFKAIQGLVDIVLEHRLHTVSERELKQRLAKAAQEKAETTGVWAVTVDAATCSFEVNLATHEGELVSNLLRFEDVEGLAKQHPEIEELVGLSSVRTAMTRLFDLTDSQ